MSDFVKYTVYFLLGGTIVSVSTYLGSQGRSFLAAFASTFPAITGATFVLIYLNGGKLVHQAEIIRVYLLDAVLRVIALRDCLRIS